eukprot:c26504_g1_i1 orf=1057-1266(+)
MILCYFRRCKGGHHTCFMLYSIPNLFFSCLFSPFFPSFQLEHVDQGSTEKLENMNGLFHNENIMGMHAM